MVGRGMALDLRILMEGRTGTVAVSDSSPSFRKEEPFTGMCNTRASMLSGFGKF
jgi:hypothetical protein